MSVTVDDMRSKLLTMDELHDRLTPAESMRIERFSVGDPIRFAAEPNWNHGVKAKAPDDLLPVYVTLGTVPYVRELTLTRATLDTLCATMGLRNKDYVAECPADLLVPHLNYWYREGLAGKSRKGTDFQFVVGEQSNALAFTKQGLTPLSNLALLDQALAAITDRWGQVDVLADYKLTHDLRRTVLRLIVPNAQQVLTGTGTPDDVWSLGVQAKNSLTGQSQTSFEGYLFRWVCTNGQIDITANSGAHTRRKDASQDEVYAWARTAVNEVLGGLEGSLDKVAALTRLGIDGSLSDTLRDIFEHYRISLQLRPKIISYLEQYDGEITMYVIMNAITQLANDPLLEASTVESLMRIGGDLTRTAEQRCGTCHRINHSH